MAREAAHGPWIGVSVDRLHARRFVSGSAGYTADLITADTCHLRLVRSERPHARIAGVDLSALDGLSEVVAVVTGDSLPDFVGPTPSRYSRAHFPGPIETWCLARGRVTYVGQPVVGVVATSARAAEAAARLIAVEYDPLPALVGASEALDPGAPVLHPGWPSNVVTSDRIATGDFDAAAGAADCVVRGVLRIGNSTSAPMETRCYVADWDGRAERLTLHGTFQNPHPTRWSVAAALGLKESQVRVVAPNVGGTFGLKMIGHPEEVLVAILARHTGRRVAFVEDRAECFLASSREQTHAFEIAGTSEGRIVAFRDRMVADIGALTTGGGFLMPLVTASLFPTVYEVANCEIDCRLVTTNKPPWQGVRGFGKEIANLVMERAVDLLAAELGLDPVLVRRRNLAPKTAFPRALPSGMHVDSGDYPGGLEQLLELFDYEAWRRRQRDAQALDGPDRLGIGIAFELTPEGASFPGAVSSGFETATVKIEPSGEVSVITSVTSPGGGNETGLAQLVAGLLGLRPCDIDVRQGDTDVSPFGIGNTSSRSLMFGGAAALLAAEDVRAKMAVCAAALLAGPARDVVFADGFVFLASAPERRVPFAEVALAIYAQAFTVALDVALPLQATRTYRPENVRHTPDANGRMSSYPSFPYSVHASAVRLDRETGRITVLDHAVVHDCGTVINPALVEGQLKGGVVMGLGAALWEEILQTPEGRVRSDRFKSYLLPRAPDVPPIRVGHRCTPSPFNPLGMKGAGESGVGGALAAVTNAVADALGPAGPRFTQIPCLPARLLDCLRGDAVAR